MKKFYSLLIAVGLCSFLNAATYTSSGNGNWTTGPWTISGVDPTPGPYPDADDDVVINHTIGLDAIASARTLTVNATGTFNFNGYYISVYGDVTNTGAFQFNGDMYFNAVGTFSSTTTISNYLGLNFQASSYTIAAGTVMNNLNYISVPAGVTVNNNGNLTNGGSFPLDGTWRNQSGSILRLSANITGAGTMNASFATNTVIYQGNFYTNIYPGTYYHLTLNATGGAPVQKNLSGVITVNGDLTLNYPVQLNAAGFNINLGGNWVNNADLNHTLATVNFNGSGTQTIARWTSTERFNNFQISGTGTVQLGNGIAGYNGAIRITGNFTQSGSTFDVTATNYAIEVDGNWSRTGGTFNPRSGTVTFLGSAFQSFTGTVTTNFYNFTFTNALGGSFTSGTYNITNMLTNTSGLLNNPGGTVTLVSTASKIAVIGNGAGTFGGTYILQRYIPARPSGWHDFSSPVASTTLADWNGSVAHEIYMSGVGGPDGTACCPTFYSVHTYNEATGAYVNVTTNTTILGVGQGFQIFLGDDLVNWNATSLPDTRGTPNSGTPSVALGFSASPDPGANLVGNPHHSHIDWSLCTKTNIDPTIYMLNNTGNYLSFSGAVDIPPLQGFFAYATAGGASIAFPQSCKTASTGVGFNRIAVPYNIKLSLTSPATEFSHEIMVNFNTEAGVGYDPGFDAYFIKSPVMDAPYLSMIVDGINKPLIKNTFNPETAGDLLTIPVKAHAGVPGSYSITADGINNVSDYSCILLEDLFAKRFIDLRRQPVYTFDMKPSDKPGRFVLHLLKKGSDCERVMGTKTNVDFFNADQVQILNTAEGAFAMFNLDATTPVTIGVYDMLGQQVNQVYTEAYRQTEKIMLPQANAMYIVKITVGDHIISQKVTVQQ